MKFKKLMTWEKSRKMLRVFRLIWERKGYSAFLSFGMQPGLFHFKKEYDGFRIKVLGLVFHHRKSYGGKFV